MIKPTRNFGQKRACPKQNQTPSDYLAIGDYTEIRVPRTNHLHPISHHINKQLRYLSEDGFVAKLQIAMLSICTA